MPAAGGTAHIVTPLDVPYGVESASWSKDGKSIYFTANMGVHNEIFKVDVATKKTTQISRGEHALGGWAFSEENGLHVFTRNTFERPSEVYTLAAAAGAQPKRVTSVFDEELAKFKTARQE